jgi:hypothetical protein
MSTLSCLTQSSFDLLPETGPAADEIRSQVWGLLSTLYPKVPVVERRRETRYPFPFLVHLTPVGDDGISPEGEHLVVIGKTISERGFGFYHKHPLAQRRMIVSLEGPQGGWFAFLIDLRWCRFTKQGWYESGGRFLEAVTSPLAVES